MESLTQRILFSEGGAFLVTGYRGVGKTSFISQVVRRLEEALPWAEVFLGRTKIIDIYLNLARPLQPSEIMHHIIRRLHDRLIEREIYHLLDPALREALTLAYHRTSLNMARKLAESSERSFGFNEASLGGDWLKAAVKMSWSSKRSRTQNYEISYLGYDDKAAEHDIICLCRRLVEGYKEPVTRWDRLRLLFSRVQPKRVGLKIVFVFDELDKLEEFTPRGEGSEKPVIDQILGALKNLFTTSGVTFVFVAGKDLQERWLDDVGKGDSVYESVFSYDKYLPCLWTDVSSICDSLLDESPSLAPYERQVFGEFQKYLAYKGRGIPRRIIRTFNEYVEWDGEQPRLVFTRQNIRKIRFFAGLQEVLDTNEKSLLGESHEEALGTQSDKRRLGVYYLIDWILRQGTSEFDLNDVLSASKRLSAKVALAEEVAPRIAEDIIRILLEADYLHELQRSLHQVFIGDAKAIDQTKVLEKKRYKITPRRLAEMGGVAADIEADMGFPSLTDTLFVERGRHITTIGKYKIVREIGRGGMGSVYEATDTHSGRKVAIKVVWDDGQIEMLGRFEREAIIMNELNHPNIVRLYDWDRFDGRLYIAMEYLDGLTLEELISGRGSLSLDLAIAIINPLIDAVQYLHTKGFVRNDIKPHNIMLTSNGRVCLVDFGITKSKNSRPELPPMFETMENVIVGTPQFMAPEQFMESAADERCDIYSLGVVMYRMVAGVYPFELRSVVDLMRAQMEDSPAPPSQHTPLPREIDQLVLKCLERDPANRFQSMLELREALSIAAGPTAPIDLKSALNAVRLKVKEIKRMEQVHTLDEAVSPVASIVAAAPGSIAPSSFTGELPSQPLEHTLAGSLAVREPYVTMKSRIEQQAAFTPIDAKPHLILMKGRADDVNFFPTDSGYAYLLEPRTTIGRSSENAIVMRDEKVSRYHAEIFGDGKSWFIEDFNSSLGTYVNGEKTITRRSLIGGEEIQIGTFLFKFNQGAPTD
jgi:serine/threonine-protein kinase